MLDNQLDSRSELSPLTKAAMFFWLAVFTIVFSSVAVQSASATALNCNGNTITVRGSSFQTGAEELWNYVYRSASFCGPYAERVVYEPNGSMSGMAAFGLRTASNPLGARSSTVRLVAVDEPPTPIQKQQMELGPVVAPSMTDATPLDDGVLHTIPVATGAIMPIVNFPVHCGVPAGLATDTDAKYARFSRPNTVIEQAFAGDSGVDTWGELVPGITGNHGRSAASCGAQSIVRVARSDASVDTSIVKAWLNRVNPSRSWLSLDNTAWANDGGSTAVLRPAHGGADPLAEAVAETAGSIGMVDLSVARANGFRKQGLSDTTFWLPLHDNAGTLTEGTKNPLSIKNGRHGANCGSMLAKSRWQNVPAGPDPTLGDWSQVNGVNTPVGYPLCKLAYKLAWDDYKDVYANAAGTSSQTRLLEQRRARTVDDFLTTMVSPQGQSAIQTFDYFKLPSSRQQQLLTVAQLGVNAIGWEK